MTPFHSVLKELGHLADAIDPVAVIGACERIAGAGRIVGHASGRERLQLAGFFMRLHHLGLRVAMQGDMNAPPLGAGDLLICSAGAGDLPTVTALMQVAQAAGADILMLTARPEAAPATLATNVICIPAPIWDLASSASSDQALPPDPTLTQDGGAMSVLPMGSLYEGVMFLLFEVMILDLRDRLGIPTDLMRARHTNMN